MVGQVAVVVRAAHRVVWKVVWIHRVVSVSICCLCPGKWLGQLGLVLPQVVRPDSSQLSYLPVSIHMYHLGGGCRTVGAVCSAGDVWYVWLCAEDGRCPSQLLFVAGGELAMYLSLHCCLLHAQPGLDDQVAAG
jgi:hypothetical protein